MNKVSSLVYPAIRRLEISMEEIAFGNFSPNKIAMQLVNAFVGLLMLVGVIYGAYMFIMGQIGDDPKEKRNGLIALFSVLVMGGVVLAIVNTIIPTS